MNDPEPPLSNEESAGGSNDLRRYSLLIVFP